MQSKAEPNAGVGDVLDERRMERMIRIVERKADEERVSQSEYLLGILTGRFLPITPSELASEP